MASAGTITDENTDSEHPATNMNTATESICPKGWALPIRTQTRTIASAGGNATYVSIFSPVAGGYYANSYIADKSTYGAWWESETDNAAVRLRLGYDGSKLIVSGGTRNYGRYIRCIQAS